MNTELKYMPVFRARQEEIKALKSLDFGERIYPCVEIFKELIRKLPKPKTGSSTPAKNRKEKTFEDDYLPLIQKIKANRVFVDLPVHLPPKTGMKTETLSFLRSVVSQRENRTNYMKKFAALSHKVIPVVSTYSEVSGERNSIVFQESDLRPFFDNIAFRIFFNSISRDFPQVAKICRPGDYVIMDLGNMELDMEDDDLLDIAADLESLNCTVIIHRSAIPKEITNKGLRNNAIVRGIDNSLLDKFHLLKGQCFSDYAGIKKDDIMGGGGISPGFVYYDAVENLFYGFRYEEQRELSEFETTIVPAVINSSATERMNNDALDYLGNENIGWGIIKNIELGVLNGGESGKSAAKFKRIGLEHYVHCIKCRIVNGEFD